MTLSERPRLALVLHAHLPFLVDERGAHDEAPNAEGPLEERWLYEAVGECYLPLLASFERLATHGVPFRVTVSFSPTLVSMLDDPRRRMRVTRHLQRLARLLEAEARRHGPASPLAGAIAFSRARLEAVTAQWEALRGDVLAGFARLARDGHVALWTTAATHAFLPGYDPVPEVIDWQLAAGLGAHARRFGHPAAGFWLPECGYAPGFDARMRRHGAHLTVLESTAFTYAGARTPLSVFGPIATPAYVGVYARDPFSSHQVWSREVGFPSHPSYREYHRDVGHEAPDEHLGELAVPGRRFPVGVKYYSVTGGGGPKRPYDPAAAESTTRAHAVELVEGRLSAARELLGGGGAASDDGPPIFVAPFDAELFGHWWFEGPLFVEHVLREAAARGLETVTLEDDLLRRPRVPVLEPVRSTWGANGDARTWLSAQTAELWLALYDAARRARTAIARAQQSPPGAPERAVLAQAMRELLLAQASDWLFMISRDTSAEYGRRRLALHLGAFDRAIELASDAARGHLAPEDQAWLAATASRDNLLPGFEV